MDRIPVHVIFAQMKEITYTDARNRFASVLDEVEDTGEPTVVRRRGHTGIALIPEDELAGLIETAHLLRSPANARRLLESLIRSCQGEGESVTINDLQGIVSAGRR
jgi:antitoxin YefM